MRVFLLLTSPFLIKITSAENDAALLNVASAAYCVCLCCEGDTGVCKRPEVLPVDFECDMSRCQGELCANWKDAKCRKDCYCMKCRNDLPINDYRCATYKPEAIADDCKCPDLNEITCNAGQPSMAEEELGELKEKADDLAHKFAKASAIPKPCFTKCYCDKCYDHFTVDFKKNCDDNVGIFEHYQKTGDVSECDCMDLDGLLECPDVKQLEEYEKMAPEIERIQKESLEEATEEMRGWEDTLTLAQKLSKETKTPEAQEKIKRAQCDLSCFCQKCTPTLGDLIEDKCTGIETVKDCDCTKNETPINCENFKKDLHCNVACMCSVCKTEIDMLVRGGIDGFAKSCSENQCTRFCDCSKTECSMFKITPEMEQMIQDNEDAEIDGKKKVFERDEL